MRLHVIGFCLLALLLAPQLAAQGMINHDGEWFFYNNQAEQQMVESLIRQREEVSRLRRDMDAQQYETRRPTEQEVKQMVADWDAKHPFESSFKRPDFSKRTIRVPKGQAAVENNQALEDRLAQIEARLRQHEAKEKREPATKAKRVTTRKPPTKVKAEAPRPPQPQSVLMRKLADGRYMVIAGGETHYFAKESEAAAFIATIR